MKRTIIGTFGAAALVLAGTPAMAAGSTPTAQSGPVTCLVKKVGTGLGVANFLGTGSAACGKPAPPTDPDPAPPTDPGGVTPPEPSDPKPIE